MAKALINQSQGKCKRLLYVLSVQSTKAFDTLVSQLEGKYAALKLYCLTNIKIHDQACGPNWRCEISYIKREILF